MLELETRYLPGKRTFVYLLIARAWWLVTLGALFGYLAYEMYFGSIRGGVVQFLATHPDWYVDVGMLAQWTALISISLFFIAFLRAMVEYRAYSFQLDERALHIRRGIIKVQEITIPYMQISNIHIEQPYHWRLFGIARLDITINNTGSPMLRVRTRSDFLIPCIDKSLGKALLHFLTRQAAGDSEEEEEDGEDADEYEDEEDGEDVAIDEE